MVIALIRGFARHSAKSIGNAWMDLTRVTLWVLLPISFVYALFLVQQGVVQNCRPARFPGQGRERHAMRDVLGICRITTECSAWGDAMDSMA